PMPAAPVPPQSSAPPAAAPLPCASPLSPHPPSPGSPPPETHPRSSPPPRESFRSNASNPFRPSLREPETQFAYSASLRLRVSFLFTCSPARQPHFAARRTHTARPP